jgi:hypothetical protein
MSRNRIIAAIAALLLAACAQAYVVVLKDGSKIFARKKYEVKGANAIIVLENGNITQLPYSQIDVPGSDRYNKENFGNVIALQTPQSSELQAPKEPAKEKENLSEFIRERQKEVRTKPSAASPSERSRAEKPPVEPADELIQREADRIFGSLGIAKYQIHAGPRVTFIADGEDAVFNAMSAAARLAADLAGIHKADSLDVEIVSSTGADSGRFRMTGDGVAALVAGAITPSEYYVQNVIF